MDVVDALNGFHFDNDVALYQEIQPHTTVQRSPFVANRYVDLTLHRDAPKPQFLAECQFIDRLKKARSKYSMYFDCSPNYFM